MDYHAPFTELAFVLDTIVDLKTLAALPKFESASPELIESILSEAGKFAEQEFAPLNKIGDVEGAIWRAGAVTLPKGYAAAYARYVGAGWNTLGADPAYGGQGLPFSVSVAVMEMLQSANMGFALCPMLTLGAIEALQVHGSQTQKALYLPRLVSGEWTGTMNLTEPQAGSDVGALRSQAVLKEDGLYRISGQKIFISWGEHDCAENIAHLVLARLPNAPPGTKGISLFVVPKFLPDADGRPGERNGVACASIEHKLGIHASPTCTMIFGDAEECIGEIVGEPHAGMKAMFTMMNHARINVGLQGVAIAERAYQSAVNFARERVQSTKAGAGPSPVKIIEHADVRRMLLTMKSTTEAIRALTFFTAAAVDRAHAEPDSEERRRAAGRADLLTPVTKAYATDMGVEVASMAIQVFGGMGFVEETGVAQYLRDSRIAPIYEGTNGIQALDLVGRKLGMDKGAHWQALLSEIDRFAGDLGAADPKLEGLAGPLAEGCKALSQVTEWLMARKASGLGDDVAAGATPYLRMFGIVVSGYLLARQAVAAIASIGHPSAKQSFYETKIVTARFFITQILPQAKALSSAVMAGGDQLYAMNEAEF